MPRPDKVAAVEEIMAEMKSASVYYAVDFRSLSVAEVTDLRGRLRAVGASLMVVKNTLAKRAAADAGLEGLDTLLQGPTALAFCREDAVAPAKVLQAFIREKKRMAIKGGYLQNRVLAGAQVEQLAVLPSREELIAKVVGGIAAPLYGLANVLTGPMRGFVVALDQVRQQKEQAA